MNTSTKRIALLFSGQGAQAVGMGQDLAAAFPIVQALFNEADERLAFPLSQIAFTGPAEELTRTSVCQPALYVHGIACLSALLQRVPDLTFVATAGLSLGEFTAHCAAGTFDFPTGLELVAQRSRFMEEACNSTNGGMAAMIGGEENDVRSLAAQTDVDVANLNCPGQIVLSGEASKIALAVSMAKEAGVRRATTLNVAGAFHSRLMEPAYQKLSTALAATTMNVPSVPVVCNVDAAAVTEPGRIRETLAEQVTGSVRWTESITYLLDELKVDLFLELGPGAVIAGLVNRIRKDTPVISISDVASLEKAVAALTA
ncbi:MAG: ACP S-malonyltransferase [Chthoniobacterales bacterium]